MYKIILYQVIITPKTRGKVIDKKTIATYRHINKRDLSTKSIEIKKKFSTWNTCLEFIKE
jgi:hypothetical protein